MILIDFKVTAGGKFWLKTELEKLGYTPMIRGIQNYNVKDESSSFGKIKMWMKYFRLAVSGIRKTNKHDVIVTDNFVIGALAAFFCQVFGYKRKIISLNMIAHQKGSLNRMIRKVVYNRAFKYKTFWFSVNDQQLITEYSRQFKFPQNRIFVMHDSYYENDEKADYNEAGDYVFTGGDAYRDWKGVIQCAENLPGIQFIGVARQKYFPGSASLPGNLKMYFDTSSDEFYSLLRQSRMVFLPLNSLAPCGLIVMMKAALLSKPVIITETPSTKNYIQHNVSGKLVKMNDINDMTHSISELFDSADMRMMYTKNLKSYVLENFSTEKNARIVNEVITI
jgi:glycosyltransferase involved in cell wall biosynthesis